LTARGVEVEEQPRRLAFGRGPLPDGSELELRSGPLEQELQALGAEGVRSLLLEGGPTLAGSFLEAGLVDKLLLFVAPTLAGEGPRAFGEAGEGRSLRDVPARRSAESLRRAGRGAQPAARLGRACRRRPARDGLPA